MKLCSRCGETKPLSGFTTRKASRDGRHAWCKTCLAERQRQRRIENPERAQEIAHRYYLANKDKVNAATRARRAADPTLTKRANLRTKFGLTLERYEELLTKQGGVCAICAEVEMEGQPFHVDHDHACCSGKYKTCGECIRGILCRNCNFGIGFLKDNPSLLRAAAMYLEKSIEL